MPPKSKACTHQQVCGRSTRSGRAPTSNTPREQVPPRRQRTPHPGEPTQHISTQDEPENVCLSLLSHPLHSKHNERAQTGLLLLEGFRSSRRTLLGSSPRTCSFSARTSSFGRSASRCTLSFMPGLGHVAWVHWPCTGLHPRSVKKASVCCHPSLLGVCWTTFSGPAALCRPSWPPCL